MSGIPKNAIENSITPCFFTTRQGLWLQLEKQSVAQLPPGHNAIALIKSIQLVLSHLLGVYTLIINFIRAGNNDATTWTPLDKHWAWVVEYDKVWGAIEKVFKRSAFIVSGRDEGYADLNARAFMTGDIIVCDFGYNFFQALISREVHENIGDLFYEIELFCKRVEQQCVPALA